MWAELPNICSEEGHIQVLKLGTSSIVIMLLTYIAKIKIGGFKITKMFIKKFTSIYSLTMSGNLRKPSVVRSNMCIRVS